MKQNVKTLKDAVKPILWLNCLFCMGIFEISANRKKRYFLSFFYVVVVLVGYVLLSYEGMYFLQKILTHEFFIFYIVLIVNIFVASEAILLFWCKSESMNDMIKRCSMVDETLISLGIQRNYRRTYYYNIYIVVFWTLSVILLNVTHVLWIKSNIGYFLSIYTNVCYCFPIMVNYVVDFTFAAFIGCIKRKFQGINNIMSTVVLCTNESNVFTRRNKREKISIVMINYKNHKDKIIHIMHTLRQLHMEITQVARQINQNYGVQVLLGMTVHFTVVTATTYSLYATFSGQIRMAVDGNKIIVMIIWGTLYSFKIILVNNICTSTINEAYKIGEIVQSFEGSAIDDDIRSEVRQFTQQIMLNSLTFSANGFFTIGNSFTGKFFAAVMTYVVIIAQMNASSLSTSST